MKFCEVPHSTQKGQGGKDGVVIVLIVKSRSLFKNLFIFACAGSSLLPGFSLVGARRATLPWSGQAYCGSFSCRGDGALGPRASVVVAGGLSSWWHVGLVVRLCVGSSHSRDGTRVPCIGAWTPVYPLCHQESPAHIRLSPIGQGWGARAPGWTCPTLRAGGGCALGPTGFRLWSLPVSLELEEVGTAPPPS